ncbi:sigma-70 family RNA polymerase sigma factor [Kocuria indica]|uniref:Sigma-70 family RNA polymerase sigma factor n=1 Tax=Kocuria marina subsp. indica TaxID=1049583 RepID=A0A6N9R144_9MICC|nr:RNA polymerase subunit sigma-70 [Kocuria indica]NDO78934.1 sigma-70 family RNA polymerase sigma factor [Kocuria indica]
MLESEAAGLVSRARQGDEDAFGALVGPHRDELLVHGYRMLGSLAEAEDCVQEALTRAWRSLGSYEERGTFRAWLYRIMTNRCLTVLDQIGRRELPTTLEGDTTDDGSWLEPLPGSRMRYIEDLDPESRLLALEGVELAFVAAIQRLPARQRAVLILRDVLSFTAAETGDLLDMTVPAVNSALQRAKRQQDPKMQARVVDFTEAQETARRYLRAWEAADVDAIVSMLAEDARYSMPPLRQVFIGAEAIRGFLLAGPLQRSDQSWRFLPAQANGQIAFGTYLWNAEADAHEPAGLDVISFTPTGSITEVVSFLEADFSAFGLPPLMSAK